MPRRCDHTAPARSKEARTVVGRLSPGGAVADGGIGGQSLSGVAIYMEGGGDGKDSKAALRQVG